MASSSSRGKGLVRSIEAKLGHLLGAHLEPSIGAALASEPSGAADLTAFWQTPFNQGQSSTCHAHSLCMTAYVRLAAAGVPLGWVPSPLSLASCTYATMRSAVWVPGTAFPVLYDTGAALEDDSAAFSTWGVAPLGPLVGGRYSDVPDDPPDNSFPEPVESTLVRSVRFAGEYAIPVDANAPRLVAASLDAGIPVQDGGPVGAVFEDENTDPNVAIGVDPTATEGHSMGILRYRTKAAGVVSAFPWEFFEMSSWGAFGLNGGRWVSGEFVCSRWALWPTAIALPKGVA